MDILVVILENMSLRKPFWKRSYLNLSEILMLVYHASNLEKLLRNGCVTAPTKKTESFTLDYLVAVMETVHWTNSTFKLERYAFNK